MSYGITAVKYVKNPWQKKITISVIFAMNVEKKKKMNKDLKKRIEDFNEIKYLKDNSKRIIIATLKPDEGTVTTAPIYKE